MRKETDLDGVKAIAKALLMTAVNETPYANRTRLGIAATNKKFIIPNLPEEQEFSATE